MSDPATSSPDDTERPPPRSDVLTRRAGRPSIEPRSTHEIFPLTAARGPVTPQMSSALFGAEELLHIPCVLTFRELDLAEDADFEQLAQHVERLYRELFGREAVPAPSELQRLREEATTHSPSHWAFLARDADPAPVAFFTLAEAFAIFARGRYGIINELWVRPDARSQGVGARVLDHCRAFGTERGWRRIDVSAPANAEWDRSFEFYRKCGFTLTGRKLKIMLDAG